MIGLAEQYGAMGTPDLGLILFQTIKFYYLLFVASVRAGLDLRQEIVIQQKKMCLQFGAALGS